MVGVGRALYGWLVQRDAGEVAGGLCAPCGSVDKASVYATSRLWRRISRTTAAEIGVPLVGVNVDRAAYELVRPMSSSSTPNSWR